MCFGEMNAMCLPIMPIVTTAWHTRPCSPRRLSPLSMCIGLSPGKMPNKRLTQGAGIVPNAQAVRRYDPPRYVEDTESGAAIRGEIEVLKRLIQAYQEHVLLEKRAWRDTAKGESYGNSWH